NPASHGWGYTGLGAGGLAWPRGKVYFVRARARDRAGNLMPPSDVPSPGYYFKVAAAAVKFKIETPQGPYTAGTAQNVTVTALDELDNVASNFTDWVTFTSEDVGAPETPGQGLPSNYQFNASNNGVKVFTLELGLRRAGDGSAEIGPKRSIKVAKLSNSLINGTTGDIVVSPDQAKCLVLALPGQSLSPGTSNGRSGAVSISTAGTPFSASVYVTDQFFNRVPSSAPATVTMSHNDPYAAQPVTSTFSGGLMTAQMTPRSKRGAWTVPGATAKTLVSVAGAGNPGACAAGSPYSSSVGVQAANTASKKLLLRLPNEGLDPGSPTGKTAAAPQEQQAASTFTATVYAADDYFNPYEPSQGMSPDVWLELSTPYGTAGTTVTLTVGSTHYPVHILAASSNTLVNAKTENASYVQASTRVVVVPNLPTKLQLLLPGQNPLPGSYSGYSGAVSDLAAGTTYWAT
ncbi:MAG: hypothetical protein AAB578_04240, partial [Elusimicrobiota bacterium]